MEWYYGNDDDLVVPKDQEQLLDRLPSPDSWSEWGVAKFESSESPKKHLYGKSFCEEVSRELHEYQLNDIAAGMNQMDDIFFYRSSLPEEDNCRTDHHLDELAKSNYSMMMSAGNYMTDMMGEMECMNGGIGSSRFLQTHSFSPSVDWENGDVAASCLQEARGCVPSGQGGGSRYVEEETSPEESVLQELERVTSQLTEQTRTCFRDALYRLAENSKQQTVNSNQNNCSHVAEEDDLMMVDDEILRLGKAEATESKTNAIDRAIANLMFKKMEQFNAEDLSAGSSVDFEQEANDNVAIAGQFKYMMNHTLLSDNAKVPIFNQDNQHKDFPTATGFNNLLSYC